MFPDDAGQHRLFVGDACRSGRRVQGKRTHGRIIVFLSVGLTLLISISSRSMFMFIAPSSPPLCGRGTSYHPCAIRRATLDGQQRLVDETAQQEPQLPERTQRRARLLRARAAETVRKIFSHAWSDWEGLVRSTSEFDFQNMLQRLRSVTEQLIGRNEEVEALAAIEADGAAVDANAKFKGSDKKSRSYIDNLLKPFFGIVLHDAHARRTQGGWIVPVDVWVYRQNKGRHTVRLALAQKLLIQMRHGIKDVDDKSQQLYEERGRLIFRSLAFRGGADGHRVRVRLGKGRWRTLPATDTNGRVHTELFYSDGEIDELRTDGVTLRLEAHGALLGTRHAEGAQVRFTNDGGVGIISDVDDTVKVTEVYAGKDVVARNTFFKQFEAVPGMPELYRRWDRESENVSFHFVSNSPIELLEPLRLFLGYEDFPFAPLHLRPLWGNERDNFKLKSIESIIRTFPMKQFILVGDSGEHDAEIYADVARRYHDNIAKILIREVDPKYQVDVNVFNGLAEEKWQVFRDASEVTFSAVQLC